MAGLDPRGPDGYDAGPGLRAHAPQQASRPWAGEYRYPEPAPDDLVQGQQWCPQQQKQLGQHRQSVPPMMGSEGTSSVQQQQMMMMQVLPMDAFAAGAPASNQSKFMLVPVAALGNSEDPQQFQPSPFQRQSSDSSTAAASPGTHDAVPLQPHAQHAPRAQQAQQAQPGQPPFAAGQPDPTEMAQQRWQQQRWEQELEKLRLQQTKLAQQQELLEQCLQMRPQQRRLPQHPPQQMQSRQTFLENGYRLKPQLHQSMGQWLPVSEEELGLSPRQGQRQQWRRHTSCPEPLLHAPQLHQGPAHRQVPPHPSSQDRSQPHAAGAWPECPNNMSAVPVWATSLDQPVEDMSRLLNEDYHSSDDEVHGKKACAYRGGLRHEDDVRHPSKASSCRAQEPPRGKQAYFDRSASGARGRGTGLEPPLEPHAVGPQQLHAVGAQPHGQLGNAGGKGAGKHRREELAVPEELQRGAREAKRGMTGSGYHDTMKLLLQTLQQEDPGNIFVCRKINAFGFRSPERLRAYFSKYGQVKGVYVSHSHVKNTRPVPDQQDDPEVPSRLRAASLGFVVMTTCEAVNSILADGPEHTVRGKTVRVGVFYRKCVPTDDEDGDDDEAREGEGAEKPPEVSPEDDDALLEYGGPFARGTSSARRRWADDDPSLDAFSGAT